MEGSGAEEDSCGSGFAAQAHTKSTSAQSSGITRYRFIFVSFLLNDLPMWAGDLFEGLIGQDRPVQTLLRFRPDSSALCDLAARKPHIFQIGFLLAPAGVNGKQLSLRAENRLIALAAKQGKPGAHRGIELLRAGVPAG